MGSDVDGKEGRKWCNKTVDVNLRDEWLADLNSMRTLELRSICEGHVASVDPWSRNAHINAAVREDREHFFHRQWDELQDPLGRLLAGCFCRGDARVHVSAEREIELNPNLSCLSFPQRFFITAEKRYARKRKRIDGETLAWLENTVSAFMTLDKGLSALYVERTTGF